MPDSAYEAARQRMLARREAKKNAPGPVSRFGSALGQSARDTAQSLGQMWNVYRGDPVAAFQGGQGLLDTVEEFKGAGGGERTAIVGEQLTGIPFRGLKDKFDKGDYAGMAGSSIIPLGMMGAGAKVGSAARAAKPAAVPKPRYSALLPENAQSVPRFVGGERGVADRLSPNRFDIGSEVVDLPPDIAATYNGMAGDPAFPTGASSRMRTPAGLLPEHTQPRFTVGSRGTVDTRGPMRVDLGDEIVNVSPDVLAQYPGIGGMPSTRNLPSSAGIDPFSGNAARAFEALVPDRYKGQQNLNPWEGRLVDPPQAPPRYPTTDPNVPGVHPLDDVAPLFDPRHQAVEAPKPAGKGKTKAATKTPPPTESRLRKNFPGNQAVEETSKQAASVRPFRKTRDIDLETLAKTGNKEAIKEQALRKKAAGGGNRLKNEQGRVDFSVGVDKAKKQLKTLGKKIPGKVADLQRGMMLTGMAIPKSALGAVGGLTSELVERALTQSPGKTLGDLGKVAKSVPEGVRRAGRAVAGHQDVDESARHLSEPGIFSKPAIRSMAAGDAMAREALESLGLSQEDALRRILNASPKSQTGKDLIAFLSKHPFIKNLVAPVGAVTSTNVIEQGLQRIPGVNMLPKVSKMDPKATTGKKVARTALGAGAGYAGYEMGQELEGEDGEYLVKGLLTALAGPYALPMGLGMAFSSKDSLSQALDDMASTVGRESPVRMPDKNTKISSEVKRRFTPAVVRQLAPGESGERRRSRKSRRRRTS